MNISPSKSRVLQSPPDSHFKCTVTKHYTGDEKKKKKGKSNEENIENNNSFFCF